MAAISRQAIRKRVTFLVQSGRSTCEFTSPLWQVGWSEGLDGPAGLLVDEFPGVRSVEATNAHRGDEFGIEVP